MQMVQLALTGSMGTYDTNAIAPGPIEQTAMVEQGANNEYARKLIKKKFESHPILIEIAKCESSMRHFDEKTGDILRGKVDRRDVGIMQINEFYHGETAKKLGLDISTIEGNLDYAGYLYEKQGAMPWKASSKCWAPQTQVALK